MSTNEIIQVLAKGQVKRGLVATIPEGWRSEQIADRLEATGFASRDDSCAPSRSPGRCRAVERARRAGARRGWRAICFPRRTKCRRKSAARTRPS